MKDTKTALVFSDDGRITSADVDATGEVAQLLGVVVPVAIAAVETAEKIAPLLAEADDATPDLVTQYSTLISGYTKSELEVSEEIQTTSILGWSAEHQKKVAGLETFLVTLRAEKASLQSELSSIETAQTTNAQYSFVLDLKDLPSFAELTSGAPSSSENVQPWRAVWEDLGIMTTIEHDHNTHRSMSQSDIQSDPPSPRDSSDRVWFRYPHYVQISLWKKGMDGTPQLVRETSSEVVDDHSLLGSVVLSLGHFIGHNDSNVSFGAMGTPTGLSTVHEGAASAIGAAVKGIPAGISDAMSSIASASSSLNGLVDPKTASQIAALTAEKQRLELQQGIAQLLAGGSPSASS